MRSSQGELVRGCCGATNLCRCAQRRYVRETVEMLLLDATEDAPTLWVVLTAREHLTRAQTYRHLDQLRRAAKRRWPHVEWFVQVEFQHRGALHLNLLVKGVPVDHADELLEILATRWCARVDALPVGQCIRTISEEAGGAGGLARYLSKRLGHGLKGSQAPPIGWRGHRTSQTRGYLVRPAAVMREEARRSLRTKDELRRAIERGLTGTDAEAATANALAIADATTWQLVELHPTGGTDRRPNLRHPRGVVHRELWALARLAVALDGRLEAGSSPPPRAPG